MLGASCGDLVQCVRSGAANLDKKAEKKAGEDASDGGAASSHIHISRVALHEAPMQHAIAWDLHVKPRLYAFAAFIHALRASTALRYEWLLGDGAAKRALVARMMPHLAGSAAMGQ